MDASNKILTRMTTSISSKAQKNHELVKGRGDLIKSRIYVLEKK